MAGNLENKYLSKQRDRSIIQTKPPFPRIIKIDTCNVCNYNCVFCPQAKQTDKIGCIDKDLCIRIIKDAYQEGAKELCLSMTGEPLINRDIESFARLAKDLGYEYVFLNTNGLLADEERGKSLLESGIDSIKFSINASKKSYRLIHGRDCYDTVLHNLKKLYAYREQSNSKCKLYVSYVAVKQTLEEAEDLIKDIDGCADDIIVMNANNRGGAISELDSCLYAGEDAYSFQYPCSQLFNNIYITAEGYMVLCCQDFENVTVVADLNHEPVAEAWNNKAFVAFRERYLNKDLKGTLCYNCIYEKNEPVIPFIEELAYYKTDPVKYKNLTDRIRQIAGQEDRR